MKRLWLILSLLFVFSCKNSIKNDTTTHNIKYQLSGFSIEKTQKTIEEWQAELRKMRGRDAREARLEKEQIKQKLIKISPLVILIIILAFLLLRLKYGLPIVLQKRLGKLYLTFNKLIVFMGINNPGWQRITAVGLIFFLILPIIYWIGYEIPIFVYLSDFFDDLIPSIGYSKTQLPDYAPGSLGAIGKSDLSRWGEKINLLGRIFFIIYHLTFYILGIKLFTWLKSGFNK